MKKLLFLAVLGAIAIGLIGASGQYKKITGSKTVYLTTSDLGDTLFGVRVEGIAAADIEDSSWYQDTILGDTILYVTPAKIISITPTVMDSARYYDSVDGTVDAGADTVSFLTPMYRVRLTPILDTSKTYIFRVEWASGDTMGFDFDCGSAGTVPTTVAILIDSLMDSITAYTDLTDSMEFHDSVSYIRMTALYATETHGGRWTVQSDGYADGTMSGYDSFRNLGRIVQTHDPANATVAIICDTLVAKHNALTTTKDSILATDYGTHFTLSTKHGSSANTLDLPDGWSVTCYLETAGGEDADSAMDTTTTQAATAKSVINGIVAAINAEATVNDTAIAYNDGDTAYYVMSKRRKDLTIGVDDRFQMDDTTDDVEGVSTVTDSIYIGNSEGFTTMHAKIIVDAATGDASLGTDDSTKLLVRSGGPGGAWTIDSMSNTTVPMTSQFVIRHSNGDSTLGGEIYLKYLYMDTISDTNGIELPFDIHWDILLK